MVTITIDAIVSDDHRLIYELPPDVPVGQVKLTIEPVAALPAETPSIEGEKKPLTREEARRRLAAAGMLSTIRYAPQGAVALSDEERERIGRLLADDNQTVLDLVNIDRGPK